MTCFYRYLFTYRIKVSKNTLPFCVFQFECVGLSVFPQFNSLIIIMAFAGRAVRDSTCWRSRESDRGSSYATICARQTGPYVLHRRGSTSAAISAYLSAILLFLILKKQYFLGYFDPINIILFLNEIQHKQSLW